MCDLFDIRVDRDIKDISKENEELKIYIKKLESERDLISALLTFVVSV